MVGAGSLTSFAYNQALGGDSSPAEPVGAGQVVVPAASAQGPGQVALYFGRPASHPPRSYVLPWNGVSFQYLVEDAWIKTAQGASICCDFDAESQRCLQAEAPTTWTGTRYVRTLSTADDVLTGSFQLTTQGLVDRTLVGEATAVPGDVAVSRTITH